MCLTGYEELSFTISFLVHYFVGVQSMVDTVKSLTMAFPPCILTHAHNKKSIDEKEYLSERHCYPGYGVIVGSALQGREHRVVDFPLVVEHDGLPRLVQHSQARMDSIHVGISIWRLIPAIDGPRPPVEVVSERVLLILSPSVNCGTGGQPQWQLDELETGAADVGVGRQHVGLGRVVRDLTNTIWKNSQAELSYIV